VNSGPVNSSLSQAQLPVAVDVMGGDLGPSVIVEGAVQAAQESGSPVLLVGNESQIRNALNRIAFTDNSLVRVQHAAEVITMEDTPAKAIRTKPNASIVVAFELVRDGKASAVVSPGNTGAMMAAGLFISGTLPGIVRPAIASFIPRVSQVEPTILLDSGANIDCNAQQLVQFAMMGDLYARLAVGISNPKVALLSNGTESSKGTDIIRSAALDLKGLKALNYAGFIEGRDIPKGIADVVVCDGFVGNIVLKTMEGTAELVIDSIKQAVERNLLAKIGMGMAKPTMKKLFHDKLDPSAYGGAPLLGLNHIGIVCHGRSNQRAILNATRVAQKLASAHLIERLTDSLSSYQCKAESDYEDGIWDRISQKFEKRKKVKAMASSSVAHEKNDLGKKE
jgi:phosphate acyltransferase